MIVADQFPLDYFRRLISLCSGQRVLYADNDEIKPIALKSCMHADANPATAETPKEEQSKRTFCRHELGG